MIDFDLVYNRKNTNSVKWDSIVRTYNETDLLPFWVADMDFKVHQPILDALSEVLQQGILGYSPAPESLYAAIQNWQFTQHRKQIEKEAILFSAGVVPSVALAIQAYTTPGDAIMIQDPVYHPFSQVIKQNDRKLVRNILIEENNHFVMDYDSLEKQIVEENVQMFILCNPHNPGGRVWHASELEKLGEICKKHHVLVVSDEIHQDIVFAPASFTTFTNAGEAFEDFSIVLTSATKTFNLAAIKNSMVFIENPDLRKRFVEMQQRNQQEEINVFGFIGTLAAYETGKPWLEELLIYLKKNIDTVEEFFANELPKVNVMRPEGTYLVWLDFSAYELSDSDLQNKFIHEAKVVLNTGITFGPSGSQHMRLNIACPNEQLLAGLQRIKEAFS